MQLHQRTKQIHVSHKMQSNSSVITCAKLHTCAATPRFDRQVRKYWQVFAEILGVSGLFIFSPVPQIFISRKISVTLQIKLMTDCNKQPKYTKRSETKVQLEFKGRQTNQKHVNVKSQGRQVSRDQWTTRGNSGKKGRCVEDDLV